MFIFVRFGSISVDIEPVVHILLVQQAGKLVGIPVVVASVASVAFVTFEAS